MITHCYRCKKKAPSNKKNMNPKLLKYLKEYDIYFCRDCKIEIVFEEIERTIKHGKTN